MYTKVTPKAGQNGPMWLYVGSELTIWPAYVSGSMGSWADGIGVLAKKAPNDLILVG